MARLAAARHHWLVVLAGLLAVSGSATPISLAVPSQTRSQHPVDPADRMLRTMTLEQKVGQLFVTWVHGRSATSVSAADAAANRHDYGVDTPAQVVARYHLGGVVYFDWSDNIGDPRQLAELSNGLQRAATSQPDIPLQIGMDQEQGLVNRMRAPATQFPGNMALGATRSEKDTEDAARITGEELAAVGVNQDFAPVADVNTNPANPVIGVRSFGAEPGLVSRLVTAAVRGYQQDAGIITAVKHFPGHGDTSTDSHTGLPVIHRTRAAWRKLDEPPFAAAVSAGADSIMTAHISVPALDPSGDPATLSRRILTGWLRDSLHYQGVIVTDALRMAGVRKRYPDAQVPVRALAAGADQLLMPPHLDVAYRAVLRAVRAGRISQTRLDASVRRVLRLKLAHDLFDHRYVNPAATDRLVGGAAHQAMASRVAEHAVTLLRNAAGVLPLRPGRRVFVTGWSDAAVSTVTAEIHRHGDVTTHQVTGDAPSRTAIGAAVGASRRSALTVVVTHDVAASAEQRALVRHLVATGRPVIVVAIGNPYDAAHLPTSAGYLVTYSSEPVALVAVARTLCGEVSPSGRLPVAIPAPHAYPVGAGLRYPADAR